jgi:hypothetical protein
MIMIAALLTQDGESYTAGAVAFMFLFLDWQASASPPFCG